ncbi:MAG: type IV secretion system DNA-binding domain-containing protein [Candidatus Moranbacteria bacterium]|nr:type IV secretion system DNA-binding domain-containing protein [Candidatus Moranbacteria bacterium]
MSDQNDISFFARTNFRNQERIFGIKEDDRRRHMYVIGKTGMGKTNLLENLAIQDIKHGKGIAFIDPHGDTAEKLIRAIPSDRINDVIYFNPADQDFPIAFNVMENVNSEYKHLIASGLVGVFKKLWADSWGPRLEYILRNAILALLEYPGSTLLGVTRILVDKDYREKVVAKITDPVVRAFWVDEFSKWNDRVLQEVISPIQNKVGQFLSTSLIRNIVGQTTSSFDVREAMDSGKILIMNLSKGRVGEDASALIGAMMITKIQLAAMERVDMPEEERKDFYLYVDEFQNFATESFANILSEARKYRLSLILANQYITQLDEKVADAVFGNAGTIIAFRVGAADAEILEKEFDPVFLMNDIVNLPKYNIYLKLMIDGIAGDAFSATVLPPISLQETAENEEKVIRISRERYASSKKEVEDKIRRWSGMLTEDERAELLRKKALPISHPIVSQRSPTVVPKQPVSLSAKPIVASSKPKSAFAIRYPRETEEEPKSAVAEDPADVPEPIVAAPVPAEVTVSVPESVPMETPEPLRDESALQTEFERALSVAEQVGDEVSEKTMSLPEVEPEERPTYPSLCDTCGMEIRVPFQPDGSRPTFCKECFKSHQRTMARAREDRSKPKTVASGVQRKSGFERKQDVPYSRTTEARVYASADEPISLSRASLVAPKKFKPLHKRPDPDLGAVRDILKNRKPKK